MNDLLAQAPSVFGSPLCRGCGQHPATTRETGMDRQRFREMTGRPWPGNTLSLNLKQDRTTLGLPLSGLPERVSVCLPCAVAHIERFNMLNTARQTARDAMGERQEQRTDE